MNNWTPMDPFGGLIVSADQLHVDMMISSRAQSFGHFLTQKRFIYGHYSMYMKLVPKDSAGCIMTYYLSSPENHSQRDAEGKSLDTHDEVDFEFLGNVTGEPIALQTNLHMTGTGSREMRHYLPFDPTAAFHKYSFLWNKHILIWFVDDKVIRVHHNIPDVLFPHTRPMAVHSSLWDGSDWATQGGNIKLNMSHAPFVLQYEGFGGVEGCEACPSNPFEDTSPACANSNLAPCNSDSLWYNSQKVLTSSQKEELKAHHSDYVIYNYCKDDLRWTNNNVFKPPPECKYNEFV